MSPKFQSNEYATYMNNIRITKDDNGILSLQFERGNKRLNLDVKGCVIGTCVLNKYLILFTQETNTFRRPTGEVVITKTDHIYRLEIIEEDLDVIEIFTGNLNFDTDYPLEALGVYENENIQKVYFIDGKNQARVINILENYNSKYQDNLPEYKSTAFDFIAELQLKEEVSIYKIIGTGEFPQGTIQYVFSYYNKHGRQSNLFTQSDLQYLAYNKGVSPEEKVNCSFKIYIDNVDRQFDYLRIYSIIRTSQDVIPTCKRVVDLEINSDNIVYIDNGTTGDIIDNTELLYLGGNTICPNTFEQKDGTLFIGNYTINNNDISEETAIKIRNLLGNKLGFKYRATSISYKGKNDYYNYEGQLGESDVAGFKYMEWYGVAIQFQNKNGRFSSPIYLGSTRNYFPPRIVDYNLSEEVGVNRGELNLDIDITELVKIIDTNIWVKARLLIVNPTNSLKTVLCQGIISSTVFNYRDRYNNAPFTMSSWRMNSLGKHLNSLFANSISWGEIQNIEFSKSPIIIGESSTTKINIKCTIYLGYYRTIVISEDNRVLYDKTSPTTIKAKENLKKWNSNIDITKISDDSWKNNATILQEIKINDVDTIVNDFGECFAYDESLVTFNSPDIENQYNNINKNTKLRIIGILKSNPLFSNYLIQGSDLNDPSKGNVPTKNIKNFTSALLWRDMDSSWDNLGDYDANKDWLFATYLWHRETSYSDNGIEKKNSDGNSRKVWSKPVKKIISNTRECTTSYLRDSLSYIDDIEEINKFNYYELPIDDIKVITTNNDAIYKLNSNMGNSYTETLSYTSDTNKLFPTNNEYPIYGQQYYAYNEDSISDYITYNTIIVDGKAVTSKDPIRIKYRETPHAIISFGSKNNSTVKLPRMSINHKSEIDRVGEDAVTRRLFWNTKNNSYTKDFIWTKYINEYTNYMNPTDIGNNYFFYNANPSINDYYYLADLCVQDPDTSPYELSNGNKDIISQYSFIPAGEAINLTGETISLRGNHGDTYYQRWDCLKTFPYSTDDKNQYIDITSFFVESRINLDGRYDKQRGLKYNLGVLNTNFNLINKSYTQRNNFFNYKQIEDEGIVNFPNQITISKTKVLGEDVDSWTNVTLASVFDLDGDKGKLNAIRKINNDLYCFQDSGISRLLYNSRVQVNTSDGVPIEIANSAKLQDKQYLSDSIGCQNKWAIKSTPQGIYFVDTYNGELYRINDKGITPISQNKFKNYFTKLSSNVWSPSLWNYENSNNFIDSIKLEYDSTTYDLYIVSRDTALAYNELLGEFTSFYDYGSTLYWVNLNDKSLQINKDSIYEAYKGEYGLCYNHYTSANIEFIVNSEFDLDKIFETVELTTSDTAKINNWKADYYPFDTLEVSNEYQKGKNEASSTNVKKKFRTWRWQIPRNSKKNEDGIITNRDRIRNMWAKIRLSKNYNSPLSIYDINVAYYS
nr:MAG TPA: stabilization protein [Crassvirales sp.]